jgi:hypothetical protein
LGREFGEDQEVGEGEFKRSRLSEMDALDLMMEIRRCGVHW